LQGMSAMHGHDPPSVGRRDRPHAECHATGKGGSS
jgi:hypothetical protein